MQSASGEIFRAPIIESVAAALGHFHKLAIIHGVAPSQILVFATEAMRRASNAFQMLDAISQATGGLKVHILDPPVETLFGAIMGSRSGLVDVPGGALFLDLGGGSVQMTWVDTNSDGYELEAAKAGESLPFGAAKVMKILLQNDFEAVEPDLKRLVSEMGRVYLKLCDRFPALKAIHDNYHAGKGSTVNVFMCGGGFRGYGSMLMHTDTINPYPIPSINTYSVEGPVFKNMQTMILKEQDAGKETKIFGMSKRRRAQFPAICQVVKAFIAVVPNIGRVTFCGGSNRQGALMMKLPRQVRESNPLTVLAAVREDEQPIFNAILNTLRTALPDDIRASGTVSAILASGIDALLVREIWQRCGHDDDSNASHALHNAITRNPDCPGMTHLVRAVLALTTCSRWGAGIGPIDVPIFQGLKALIQRHDENAFFWTQYIGGISAILASVLPIFPKTAAEVQSSIR